MYVNFSAIGAFRGGLAGGLGGNLAGPTPKDLSVQQRAHQLQNAKFTFYNNH